MKGKFLSKALSLAIVATLILSIIATGCQKTPENQSPNTTPSPSAETEQDKPIEITYMTYTDLAQQDSYTTQKLPELLKEKGFNVTFKIETLGTHNPQEWRQKHSLMIASGEYPVDVMQIAGLTPEAVKAGWFAELDMDMIQNAIPTYAAQVDKIDPNLWAFGMDPDSGKLYGIPSYNMFGSYRHTFAYRGDWLDKFGMEAPTNLEEFEQWLIACRTQDPNGNGQKDEYGYTSQDGNHPFSEIFGAFGVMPGFWMLKDGKVVRGETQPEVKEALALLRKWYSEDLIPKGIMTTVKRDNDFYAGLVGTLGQGGAYAPQLVPTGAVTTNLKANFPDAKLTVVPSPEGPEGKSGTLEWGPKKYNLTFGSHLEKEPEKLEMLMKMFETIATDKELFEIAMLGEKGVHWDYEDSAAGKGATKFLEPYLDSNMRVNEVGVKEMSESAFCPIWVEDVFKDYLDPLALEYASQNNNYYDVIFDISIPAKTKYFADLLNLYKATYLEIITGKKPLDAFDDFVKLYNEKGGDEMTKEANELYNKMFKK